jgi:hypothetical protein
LQKNCPPTHRQVTEPYVHCWLGGVEHAMPGGGSLGGQGALQCQVSPIGPAKHVQSVLA